MSTADEMKAKREEAWTRLREAMKNGHFGWDISRGSDYSAYFYMASRNYGKTYRAEGYGHRPGEHVDMSNDKTIDGTCTEIPDPLPQLEDKT